jgi:hypothetical protein
MISTPALRTLVCAAALGLAVLPARAQTSEVAGQYFCVAGGNCPCQADTDLQLDANGVWRWGGFAGTYRASRDKVEFAGGGGAATWGPATVGTGTLTFNTGGASVVCWQPSKAGPRGGSRDD